jgi:RNase P/RNase MRP subunit POP5
VKEIRNKCKNIFNKDFKEMGLSFVQFEGNTGIIKCKHIERDNTVILLKSIQHISSEKVEIIPIATSGTIRSLIKKHMTHINVLEDTSVSNPNVER